MPKAKKKKKKPETPLMVECDECCGKGEYQASCSECGKLLTEENVAEEHDDLCAKCLKKFEKEDAKYANV